MSGLWQSILNGFTGPKKTTTADVIASTDAVDPEKEAVFQRLIHAVSDNDTEEVLHCIEAGVNVDGYGDLSSDCLVEAIENPPMVQLLLKHGANPNLPDSFYLSALDNAISEGSLDVVKILIDYGADVNGFSGMTGDLPLHIAFFEEQKEIFQYLISKGANPKIRTGIGQDIFTLAHHSGRTELLADYLKDSGCK